MYSLCKEVSSRKRGNRSHRVNQPERPSGAIETSAHAGLCARALLGTLTYTFARILRRRESERRRLLFARGNGFAPPRGERRQRERAFHALQARRNSWTSTFKASGLEQGAGISLIRGALGKTGKLSRGPLRRTDTADMRKTTTQTSRITCSLITENNSPNQNFII